MAVKIDTDALINSIRMNEQAGDPAIPGAGYWRLYIKAGGIYLIDDAGNITGPLIDASSIIGWELITETILGADGVFTFNAIPNTYRKLRVEATVRGTFVNPTETIGLRVGSGGVDAGANYTYVGRREGSAATTINSIGANEISGIIIPGSTATPNYFGQAVFEIFNYKNVNLWKTVIFNGGHTETAGYRVAIGNGSWKSLAVIDTVHLFGINVANFLAGSVVRLYGGT